MATKQPKGLGMGLQALMAPVIEARPPSAARAGGDSHDADDGQAAPSSLKLTQLQAGKYQPRTRMDEGSLYELAQSIRSQGVMQPILVRPLAPNGKDAASRYEIIAGERRFRAAQLAGLDSVPVLVRAVPDEAAAVMSLIENIQREELNALEEAQGLKRLVDEFGLTHDQAAQAVGRSRSAASNLMRLLQLAEPVQHLLMAGDLDMGHARALLGVTGAQQIMLAQDIVARGLSVREAERLVAKSTAAPRQQPLLRVKQVPAADVLRLQERLADHLAAPVEVRTTGKGKKTQAGELLVRFSSFDELQGVLQRMGLTSE